MNLYLTRPHGLLPEDVREVVEAVIFLFVGLFVLL